MLKYILSIKIPILGTLLCLQERIKHTFPQTRNVNNYMSNDLKALPQVSKCITEKLQNLCTNTQISSSCIHNSNCKKLKTYFFHFIPLFAELMSKYVLPNQWRNFFGAPFFLVGKFQQALCPISEYAVQFPSWCAENRGTQCTICCFKTKCPCKLTVHRISSNVLLLDSRMIAKAKKYRKIVKTAVSWSSLGAFRVDLVAVSILLRNLLQVVIIR